jgi:hypothetical protein
MVSEKALYWMSVALLAVGVTNHFALQGDVAPEIAARTSAFAERVLDRGAEYATYAGLTLSQHSRCPSARPVVATTQIRLARLQSTLACERAGFGKLQAEKAQLLALRQMKMAKVKIHMQNIRVNVPNVVVETSY